MVQTFRNKILSSVFIIAFLGLGYWGYQKYYPVLTSPCNKPLTYSIGSFGNKFNISKDDFNSALKSAEAIWETASNRDLFEETADGKVKVNLVYDYRQQAIDRLKSLGITIDTTKKSYDSLKVQYDAKLAVYNTDKSQLTSLTTQYNSLKAKYEQDLKAYNNSRRPTQAQYDQLRKEQDQINSLINQINAKQTELQKAADDVNAVANILNQVAAQLNLNVDAYNQVGQSTGSEFQEGLYTSDSSGQNINIYEFQNHDELVRVLAHELGHALGMDHVDDPDAIMYRLNQSKNEIPTAADLAELKNVCKIK
jgi:methyl-accepting chemotaxis protein